MTVNAHTTLDLLSGVAEGHSFTEEAAAVLNVTSPKRDPEHVTLQLELDNADLEALRPHADTVRLSSAEAKTLATELEEHAERIETVEEE